MTLSQQLQVSAFVGLFNFRYRHYVLERGLFKGCADHDNLILREAADERATNIATARDGIVVGSVRFNRANDAGMEYHRSLHRIDNFMSGNTGNVGIITRLSSSGDGVLLALAQAIAKHIADSNFHYVTADGRKPDLSFMFQSAGLRVYQQNVEVKELGLSDLLYFNVEEGRISNNLFRWFAG